MKPGGKHLFSFMKYARAKFLSAVSRSERNTELLNPMSAPPAIRLVRCYLASAQ